MTEAPSAFGSYVRRDGIRRDWAASLLASSTIYVALAVAAVTLVPAARKAARVAAVELEFVEKVVNEPPPPPPQVVDLKPEAPAAAALPSSGRSKKVRRLEKPPPPREMVAPKAMPPEASRQPGDPDPGAARRREVGRDIRITRPIQRPSWEPMAAAGRTS